VFRVTFKAGEMYSAVIPLAWRVSFLFFPVAQWPNLGLSSLVLRFLDHTKLDANTPGSTPLNEWSAT